MSVQKGFSRGMTEKFVLDTGPIYLGWGTDKQRPLGLCSGGSTFKVENEIRHMEFDGVRGKMMGGSRIIGVNVELETNVMVIDKDILQLLLPTSTATTETVTNEAIGTGPVSYTAIKQKFDFSISKFAYMDVAVLAKYAGSDRPMIFIVKNAMIQSEFSLSMVDKDELKVPMKFVGTFDPDDIEAVPYEILIPPPEQVDDLLDGLDPYP